MTQFFDALERQLVALSMETPRMTPRARARRRLAVGTVTVLCLFALVAGALGLVGTEYLAAQIAWILFVVFLILAVVSLVVGRTSGPPV